MKNILKVSGIITALLLAAACSSTDPGSGNIANSKSDTKDYTVAAYYFPNYHPDARNIRCYGNNWTEWELVKQAKPRFTGHSQPKVPAWGYTDESDPVQMAQKIEAAAEHGLDVFVFDWYYYDDGPFLEAAIEKGYFGAKNNSLMQFALMWANHDWIEIFPADSASIVSEEGPDLLYPGKISPATWDQMTDYLINTYFAHPGYWKIDNAPYFSIYDMTKFLDIFGNMEAAAEGVEQFRKKVKAAGFRDLHLNAVVWGSTVLPSEEVIPPEKMKDLLNTIGFTSTTSYVWIHHVTPEFPTHDYNDVKEKYFNYASGFQDEIGLPYFPNVTMGWDSSPRTRQDGPFRELGYPYTGIFTNNTPDNFKKALIEMKQFLDKHPNSQKTFIINCWNEWTEGSYLEPDTVNQMSYLEAIDVVFN